jgi:hypothetical protein
MAAEIEEQEFVGRLAAAHCLLYLIPVLCEGQAQEGEQTVAGGIDWPMKILLFHGEKNSAKYTRETDMPAMMSLLKAPLRTCNILAGVIFHPVDKGKAACGGGAHCAGDGVPFITANNVGSERYAKAMPENGGVGDVINAAR